MEDFLKLVDQIIENLKKNDLQENLFREIVEPLFKGIEPIVDDYFGVFREAHRLSRSEADWEKALTLIRKIREDMFKARNKVRKMVMLLREFDDEKINTFSISMLSFFYSTNHETIRNASTDPSELLALLRSLEKLSTIVAGPEDLTNLVTKLKKVKKKICRDIDDLLFNTQAYAHCQSFSGVDDEYVTKEILRGHTGVTLENLERSWESIASAYSHLRISLPLKAKKIRKPKLS